MGLPAGEIGAIAYGVYSVGVIAWVCLRGKKAQSSRSEWVAMHIAAASVLVVFGGYVDDWVIPEAVAVEREALKPNLDPAHVADFPSGHERDDGAHDGDHDQNGFDLLGEPVKEGDRITFSGITGPVMATVPRTVTDGPDPERLLIGRMCGDWVRHGNDWVWEQSGCSVCEASGGQWTIEGDRATWIPEGSE